MNIAWPASFSKYCLARPRASRVMSMPARTSTPLHNPASACQQSSLPVHPIPAQPHAYTSLKLSLCPLSPHEPMHARPQSALPLPSFKICPSWRIMLSCWPGVPHVPYVPPWILFAMLTHAHLAASMQRRGGDLNSGATEQLQLNEERRFDF